MLAGGAAVLEIVENLVGHALLEDVPVTEQESVIGVFYDFGRMGDEDDGDAFLLHLANDLENEVERIDVDAGVGLIHHHDRGLHRKDGGQLDAFALPTGKPLIHGAFSVPIRVEPDHREDPRQLGSRPFFGPGEHELVHRQPFEAGGLLPGEGNAAAGSLIDGELFDGLTSEKDVSGVLAKAFEAHNDRGEGRLAGTVWADEGMNVALPQVETQVSQNIVAAEGQREITDLQYAHGLLHVNRGVSGDTLYCSPKAGHSKRKKSRHSTLNVEIGENWYYKDEMEQDSDRTDPASPFRGDGYVEITVAEDGMSAWASFSPHTPGGKPVTRGYVEQVLKYAGVSHGVDWDAVDEAVGACSEEGEPRNEVVVARGTAPKPHVPAHYTLTEAFAAKRNMIDEAARDPVGALRRHHELPVVLAGHTVAELEPDRPGEFGVDVSGEYIPFGEDEPERLGSGENTAERGERIVAEQSGLLRVAGGEISVDHDLTLSCDVDNATGNISFPGSLTLTGTVHDGFALWIGADLTTKEVLDAHEVFCRGKLTALGGIIGKQQALVRSRGKVRTKFVESCTVECKSAVYVERSTYNADIFALDRVVTGKHGKLVGGEIRSAHGVAAEEIGNRAEIRTVIAVGADFIIERKLQQVKSKIEKLQAEIDHLGGRLATHPSQELEERRLRLAETRQEYTVILSNLVGKLDRDEHATVVARSTVHRGTIIEICRATFVVEETRGPTTFRLDAASGRILVESPEEGGDGEDGAVAELE